MQQEKKQTVCFDGEAKPYPWQQEVINTLMKGQVLTVYGCGRRTGKSYAYMTHNSTNFAMNMSGTAVFGSPWDEWENVFVWPWDRKTSVESGEKIWGRIKVRYNKVVWEANGKQKQYATKKEVFTRKLRGTD